MKKKSYLTVTDQFCGAGGSSQGVRKLANRMGGGLEVKLAMNHWSLAIETHNTNFPDTEHDCADISASDPRRYQSTDVLITSPECTNHSLAKGKKRSYQATNTLFGKLTVDPSAERSRATMWDVPRFAEIHDYNLIITENVVDVRSWIMWDAWLHAMYNLGYKHKVVYANSMFFHPVPQSRDRMYVVFWKKGNPAPDLEYKPKAFCSHCETEIDSVQSWKNPRRQFGKYKQQYVYRCPRCAGEVEPYYYSAFNVIDWSIPGIRIGDRNKPLADNTMKRIQYGLDKYGDSDFVVYLDHSKAGNLVSGIGEALNTQTTAQVAALVTKGGYSGGIASLIEPQYTMTTQHNYGAVGLPFVVSQFGNGTMKGLNDALGTVMTKDKYEILKAPFIVENYGTSKTREITKPFGAITAGGINHGILSNESINAFLSYYYGNAQATGMNEPSGTVSTRDRIALVMKPNKNIKIEDCTYRMLKPHEVKGAMAFDKDYVVCGNSRDQVKQLGNAVTPPAMEWLVERGIQTFM